MSYSVKPTYRLQHQHVLLPIPVNHMDTLYFEQEAELYVWVDSEHVGPAWLLVAPGTYVIEEELL